MDPGDLLMVGASKWGIEWLIVLPTITLPTFSGDERRITNDIPDYLTYR